MSKTSSEDTSKNLARRAGNAGQPQKLTLHELTRVNPGAKGGKSAAERFWEKVEKREPDDCWYWTAMSEKGYGLLKVDGIHRLAHRISFVMANGDLDSGTCVLHSCDNPPCVNPAHLSEGTRAENNYQCEARGRRQIKGEDSVTAKLSNEAVTDIRANYHFRQTTLIHFAKKYGVGTSEIHRVVKRQNWNHLP